MSTDLEKRLDAVCESLDIQRNEFDQAAKCLIEAIQVMHERVERVEQWMLEKNKLRSVKTKART